MLLVKSFSFIWLFLLLTTQPLCIHGSFTYWFPSSLKNYWTRIWQPSSGPASLGPNYNVPLWIVVNPSPWSGGAPPTGHFLPDSLPPKNPIPSSPQEGNNPDWNPARPFAGEDQQIPQKPYLLNRPTDSQSVPPQTQPSSIFPQQLPPPPPPPPSTSGLSTGVLLSPSGPHHQQPIMQEIKQSNMKPSPNHWSSIREPSMPQVQNHQLQAVAPEPYPVAPEAVRSVVPYPIIVNPANYWRNYGPSGPAYQTMETFFSPAWPVSESQGSIPDVEHHDFHYKDGFAGLPGKIRGKLTLNYIPHSPGQELKPETMDSPRPSAAVQTPIYTTSLYHLQETSSATATTNSMASAHQMPTTKKLPSAQTPENSSDYSHGQQTSGHEIETSTVLNPKGSGSIDDLQKIQFLNSRTPGVKRIAPVWEIAPIGRRKQRSVAMMNEREGENVTNNKRRIRPLTSRPPINFSLNHSQDID